MSWSTDTDPRLLHPPVLGRNREHAQAGGPVCVDGVQPSFHDIFIRYHDPIYRYLLGMVGDVAQAQDLTQDTFLKAYTAMRCRPDPVRPAWLYRIATNTARDALRHRHRLTWVPFAPGDDDRLPAPARDLPTRLADDEAVHHALARLTPPQRACLLLRARDGLSIAEIAHAMSLSSGAVKMTLSRAKERFRALYDRDEGPRSER